MNDKATPREPQVATGQAPAPGKSNRRGQDITATDMARSQTSQRRGGFKRRFIAEPPGHDADENYEDLGSSYEPLKMFVIAVVLVALFLAIADLLNLASPLGILAGLFVGGIALLALIPFITLALVVVVIVLLVVIIVRLLRGDLGGRSLRYRPSSAIWDGETIRNQASTGPQHVAQGASQKAPAQSMPAFEQRHSDEDEQQSETSTEPQPAVRVAQPMSLIRTYQIDEDDQQVDLNDPDQWPNPPSTSYTPQERQNHPHNKQEWTSFGAWTIAAMSARGVEHRKGKYRDDDFAIKVFTLPSPRSTSKGISNILRRQPQQLQQPYAAIIAIADGLGSKPLSRHGARAAVTGATQVDEQKLLAVRAYIEHAGGDPAFTSHLEEAIGDQARELLRDVFMSAAKSVEAQAKRERDKGTVEDIHSTLIILIAFINPNAPDQLVVISSQVGDGAVYTYAPSDVGVHAQGIQLGGEAQADGASDASAEASNTAAGAIPSSSDGWTWLQKPQVEPTGTQVTPFMVRYYADHDRLLRDMHMQAAQVKALLAMTDGPAEALTPYDPEGKIDPFINARPFYRDVFDSLVNAASKKDDAARGEDFVAEMRELLQKLMGIGDDVTLVCVVHSDSLTSGGVPQPQASQSS